MHKHINEIIAKAQKESQKYNYLHKLIDWESTEKQLSRNPFLYLQEKKEVPLNILESLLRPPWDINPVYDAKVNLLILEEGLKILSPILTENDKRLFSSKISNLSNTAFWDTAPEIWIASQLYKSGQEVKLDFPLAKAKKGYTPPNVDVAIVDAVNNPIWLIDAFCPVLDLAKDYELIFDEKDGAIFIEFLPNKARNWIIEKMLSKYDKKFSVFCESFPNAKFALFLSVIKSDMITLHFSNVIKPMIIDNKRFQKCNNLYYALAGRFQNDNGKLSLLKLVEFNKV